MHCLDCRGSAVSPGRVRLVSRLESREYPGVFCKHWSQRECEADWLWIGYLFRCIRSESKWFVSSLSFSCHACRHASCQAFLTWISSLNNSELLYVMQNFTWASFSKWKPSIIVGWRLEISWGEKEETKRNLGLSAQPTWYLTLWWWKLTSFAWVTASIVLVANMYVLLLTFLCSGYCRYSMLYAVRVSSQNAVQQEVWHLLLRVCALGVAYESASLLQSQNSGGSFTCGKRYKADVCWWQGELISITHTYFSSAQSGWKSLSRNEQHASLSAWIQHCLWNTLS